MKCEREYFNCLRQVTKGKHSSFVWFAIQNKHELLMLWITFMLRPGPPEFTEELRMRQVISENFWNTHALEILDNDSNTFRRLTVFFSSLISSMSLTTKYVEPRWSEKKHIQRKQWKRRIIGYHYHLIFSQATWFKDDVPLLGALDFDEKYAFIAFCHHYKKYHIFDCNVLLLAFALLWYHNNWLIM